MKQLLVTYALPYANGPLHLGHLMGLIQTDIWVRHQRLSYNICHFVCGDDAHGTPIMIKAAQEGLSPEAYAAHVHQEHRDSIHEFHIAVDEYYTTHSPENAAFARLIYQRLQERGDIESRLIKQAFDPEAKMFLPDRYVKGSCPRCHAEDQYGDHCEQCGATYSPAELHHPRSTLTGAIPELKTTEHYFFRLDHYTDMLRTYIQGEHLQPEVAHKLQEWFVQGLQPWDITRDAPYFGFTIPGHDDKYFYVWLDAPIGYMASFQHFCDRESVDFNAFWQPDSPHELIHFIGKDIIYFHALFWPAMLYGSEFRTPSAIYTHGFITINGQKMSKSRGTFITAKQFHDIFPADYFRYYLGSKMNGHLDDVDFNFEEFMTRINADLVGKVVNIASRCAKFINQHFNHQLSSKVIDPQLLAQLREAKTEIIAAYENRQSAKAVRQIMFFADLVNQFIDQQKPWLLMKELDQADTVQAICTLGLEAFRLLINYLKPILPALAQQVENFLQIEPLTWDTIDKGIFGRSIAVFQPLVQRIQAADLDALRVAIGPS